MSPVKGYGLSRKNVLSFLAATDQAGVRREAELLLGSPWRILYREGWRVVPVTVSPR